MAILIDDREISMITYSPEDAWRSTSHAFNEYLGTATFTNVTGLGVTATLIFSGTSVGVYGTVSSSNDWNSPPCSYTIDGGNPTIFTAPMLSETQYRVLFFQSPELAPDSQHTLVITVLPVIDYSTIFLDFFAVTLPIATTSESSLSSSATTISSSTTTIPSSTTTIPSLATPIPSGTTSQVASFKPPVGPIIGGVLGGLALLTFAFIAFLFFQWTKDRLNKESNSVDNGGA